MITTVTGKNQITIPALLARKYQLEPGACLEWHEGQKANELRIVVHPGPKEILRSVRELGAVYRTAPDASTVLENLRREDDPAGLPPKTVYRIKKRSRS